MALGVGPGTEVITTPNFRETFGFRAGDFPVAERIGDESLSLPFYPNMPREHADFVVDELARVLERSA